MAVGDVTAEAVRTAIGEYDRLGQDAFLRKYGFRRSRTYILRYEGRGYDSKAILGAAHGYLAGRQPLTWEEFSGGKKHTAMWLRNLGFDVTGPGRDRPPSREEV